MNRHHIDRIIAIGEGFILAFKRMLIHFRKHAQEFFDAVPHRLVLENHLVKRVDFGDDVRHFPDFRQVIDNMELINQSKKNIARRSEGIFSRETLKLFP